MLILDGSICSLNIVMVLQTKTPIAMSCYLDIQYYLSNCKLSKRKVSVPSMSRQSSISCPAYMPKTDEMKKVFDRFDIDRDGKISPHDYKAVLRCMGSSGLWVMREVSMIFEVADLNGDGYIDFEEFVEMQRDGGIRSVDLQSAFRVFDRDGDGKICAEDLFEVLRRLGEGCSLLDCQKMVRAVDGNGDGVVDIDEFITMMTSSMRPMTITR
ncbi:unnamed protein product [Cuscuta europaea]|uniref:EF-hand domain-containing protein n=1 Tax=Cuscuta europaea TaxID=41803 RepID=A0A9P0ZGJ1_CUSEU|nr:unnamed protein product [Cuscuta europaea]